MRQGWQSLRMALGFLTVLPVARGLDFSAERLGHSMGLFPAAGLLIGFILVVADSILGLLLPRPVTDLLLVTLLALLTGGLHLDGLADTCDGLGSGQGRDGALRIMKDSCVGSMGATALILVLLLKYVALGQVAPEFKNAALLLMPAAGRWLPVTLALFCPYARPEGGTGGAFVSFVGQRELTLATLTVLLAGLVLFGGKALIFLFFLALAALLAKRYFEARLGGVTGDVLGAVTEGGEVLALLLLLALL
jgi:adenosylcobinamide-GDP ribazoletransferase